MEVFEKSKKHKEAKEDAERFEKAIKEIISENFVKRYQTKLIKADYLGCQDNEKEIKVYYPVLGLPKGFSKKEEIFFRELANVIKHQYTLIDESGRQIKVEEKACFSDNIIKEAKDSTEIEIFLKSYITSELIYYRFEIDGENYCFERKFSYEEMLEQVIQDDKLAVYVDESDYEDAQKSYEEYLKSYAGQVRENVSSLKELISLGKRKEVINTKWVAKFRFRCQEKELGFLIFSNPKFDVRIRDLKNQYSVEVRLFWLETDRYICGETFTYSESKRKEKYQNSLTLHKIFELFK